MAYDVAPFGLLALVALHKQAGPHLAEHGLTVQERVGSERMLVDGDIERGAVGIEHVAFNLCHGFVESCCHKGRVGCQHVKAAARIVYDVGI